MQADGHANDPFSRPGPSLHPPTNYLLTKLQTLPERSGPNSGLLRLHLVSFPVLFLWECFRAEDVPAPQVPFRGHKNRRGRLFHCPLLHCAFDVLDIPPASQEHKTLFFYSVTPRTCITSQIQPLPAPPLIHPSYYYSSSKTLTKAFSLRHII